MTCSFISRRTNWRTISKRLVAVGGKRSQRSDKGDYSQHNGAAQYFHRIAAHADIGKALAFARCSAIHFPWTTALHPLSNQHLLIALCDSVLDHPAGSAAGR